MATNTFLIPVTGFAPGMITKLDTSSRPAYDATSLTIEIPVLKVNSSIVGVESKQGSWDVSWLQGQVGWLNGTAYPTWKGNRVLIGHVVNADRKPGVFFRLKSLGVGEYIFVYGAGYRYTYKVVSNALVQPNDASVMKHEDKSFLTLITCDTYDEKTGTYLHRVVIGAALVDVRPIINQ
ncbi:MAG TPA: class F sortase [Anaerolineales bacterium]|nr:class F sortase [Anaerolineales bacterium]